MGGESSHGQCISANTAGNKQDYSVFEPQSRTDASLEARGAQASELLLTRTEL
jgi:hypothetical protein